MEISDSFYRGKGDQVLASKSTCELVRERWKLNSQRTKISSRNLKSSHFQPPMKTSSRRSSYKVLFWRCLMWRGLALKWFESKKNFLKKKSLILGDHPE